LRVPALAQALLGCRLALLQAPGTLDVAAQLPMLLAITANPMPPAAAEAGVTALRLVVTGVLERQRAGKTTADDQFLLLGPLRPQIAQAGVEAGLAALLGDAG